MCRHRFVLKCNMYTIRGKPKEKDRELSLVEVTLEAGTPFGPRLRGGELLKEFKQRPRWRGPLHLLQRIHQLLRRDITPIHLRFTHKLPSPLLSSPESCLAPARPSSKALGYYLPDPAHSIFKVLVKNLKKKKTKKISSLHDCCCRSRNTTGTETSV